MTRNRTDDLIRPAMAASLLGVSTSTVFRWAKIGMLPQPVRMEDGRVFFHSEDIRNAKNKCLPGPNRYEQAEAEEMEADLVNGHVDRLMAAQICPNRLVLRTQFCVQIQLVDRVIKQFERRQAALGGVSRGSI